MPKRFRKTATSPLRGDIPPFKKKKSLKLQNLNKKLLEYAADNNIASLTKCLKQGADITHQNASSQSTLYIAAACGFVDIVRLVRPYTNLQYIPGPMGAFPQHISADNGFVDSLRELLKNEAAPQDQTTTGGRTPLYMCAQSNRANCVKFLLTDSSSRANPLLSDVNQVTPLAIACQLGCYDSVFALLTCVAPRIVKKMLNSRDCAGYTPLHTAAWAGQCQIVDLLLQKGADASILNHHGKRPMEVTQNLTVRLQLSGRLFVVDVPRKGGGVMVEDDHLWEEMNAENEE